MLNEKEYVEYFILLSNVFIFYKCYEFFFLFNINLKLFFQFPNYLQSPITLYSSFFP
jgi:hypothetical protein